ncbi:MAG: hypothetical protein JNJ71_11765 [Rubrivivax sp.]|nr:hypothetical protein [Rubrivivax sp.]
MNTLPHLQSLWAHGPAGRRSTLGDSRSLLPPAASCLTPPRPLDRVRSLIVATGGAASDAEPARENPPPLRRADAVPALTVQLLDGFRVWVGTQPLADLPQGKPGSLFKLLLLQRQRPLPRHRLAALYWPEADAASARNNLNVSLHRLRRLLEGHAQIVFRDGSYQLLVEGEVWVDAEQFERLAAHGAHLEAQAQLPAARQAYEAAAQLYQTDLVPQPDGDAALAAAAQSLRDRLSQVLERAAALCEQAADWHACRQHALRCLALDECNEAAHRQLMRCYARLDQPLQVERQYQRCITALRLQLGLAPAEETKAQYRRLAERQAA